MRARALERFRGAFESSPLLYAGREANQRLVLCVPVLLYCSVVHLISDGGQSCVRGIRTSVLLSKFYRMVRCQHLGVFLSTVCYWERLLKPFKP